MVVPVLLFQKPRPQQAVDVHVLTHAALAVLTKTGRINSQASTFRAGLSTTPSAANLLPLFLQLVSNIFVNHLLATNDYNSINKSTVTVNLKAGEKALLTDATIRTTGVTRINVTYKDEGSGDCQLYAGIQYYNTNTEKDKLFWLAPLNKCLKASGEDSYDLFWLGRGGLWELHDWSGPNFTGTRTYNSQTAISVKPADANKDSYMTSGQLVF